MSNIPWNKNKDHPKYKEWYEKIKGKLGRDRKGIPSWNSGLTKETDERIRKSSNTLKLKYKLGLVSCGWKKGRILSEDKKKKLSERMKNGGGLKARLSSKFNKISKPELLLKEILDKNNIKYIQQYNIGRFIIDFYLPNNKIAIEVDGLYWHNLPKSKERDKIKNNIILENDIALIRFWENEITEEIVIPFLNSSIEHLQKEHGEII